MDSLAALAGLCACAVAVLVIAMALKWIHAHHMLRRWSEKNGYQLRSVKVKRLWFPKVHSFTVSVYDDRGRTRCADVTISRFWWHLVEDVNWMDTVEECGDEAPHDTNDSKRSQLIK